MRNHIQILGCLVIFVLVAFVARATNNSTEHNHFMFNDYNSFSTYIHQSYPDKTYPFSAPGLCKTQTIKFNFSAKLPEDPNLIFSEINQRFLKLSQNNPECIFSIYKFAKETLLSNNLIHENENEKLQITFNIFLDKIMGVQDDSIVNQTITEIVDASEKINEPDAINAEMASVSKQEADTKIKEITSPDAITDSDNLINKKSTIIVSEEQINDRNIELTGQDYTTIGAAALTGIGFGMDPIVSIVGAATSVIYSSGYLSNQLETKTSFSQSSVNQSINIDYEIIFKNFVNIQDDVIVKIIKPLDTYSSSDNKNNLDTYYNSLDNQTTLELIFSKPISDHQDMKFGVSTSSFDQGGLFDDESELFFKLKTNF